MERRASTRWPLNLKSTLSLPKIAPQPCVISDFGKEGLGIRHDPALSAVLTQSGAPSSDAVATLSFSHPTQPAEQVLPVKLVHASEGQAGALLVNSAAEVQSFLQASTGQTVDVAITPEARYQILQQCLYCLQQSLSPLFDQFLNDLPPALTQAADASTKDSVRAAFMDSLVSIRNHSGRILRLFRQEMADSLSREGECETEIQGQLLAPEVSPEEKYEFESWLALKVMVTKAETLYRADLLVLKMRLDRVGIVSTLGYQNPLGPQLIGHAFRKTLEPMKLPPVAEKLCYRLFEKMVLKRLEPLYRQLNLLLVQYGVLPDLDLSRYLSQEQDSAEPEPEPEPELEPELEPEEDRQNLAPEPDPLLATPEPQDSSVSAPTPRPALKAARAGVKSVLRRLTGRNIAVPRASVYVRSAEASPFRTTVRLLGMLAGAAQEADVPGSTGMHWPAEAVQDALARIQKQRLRRAPSPEYCSLKSCLLSNLQTAGGEAEPASVLHPVQEQALDLVDAFVRSLMTLPALGESVRTLIWRLEIPLYLDYQRDPQLFERPQAPILQVINHVVWLERHGWRPERHHPHPLEQVVGPLCESPEPNELVVEQCLERLGEMLDWQKSQLQRNQERAVAAAEGARKVNESRLVVSREISLRIAGKQVPKVVLRLINSGWQELMSLTFIRQGPDSATWRHHLSVLDLLLKAGEGVQPEQAPELIVNQIEGSLRSVSVGPVVTEPLSEELLEFLRSPGQKACVEVPPDQFTVPAGSVPADAETRADLQSWMVRALKFRAGDWFRLSLLEEGEEYVRLARIGKSFSRFLFVSRFGQKVADWDANKLARRMRKNAIFPEPDYERPAVESALELMVRDVYQQIVSQAGQPVSAPAHIANSSPGPAIDLGDEPDFSNVLLRGQKIIPLGSRSKLPVQYQVLLSAYDRQGRLMSTADYVQAVVRQGWGQALDRWVLEQVLGWMNQNVSRMKAVDSLCISLTGQSLQDESLLEFVYEHLAQSDVPLEKVCFEISEQTICSDHLGVTDFMRELREYGCRFSLSHVDPALSSFDHIRHLPLDFVKFDGRLMARLMTDPQAPNLCKALAEVTHLFGCELVAGQVETRSGLELLRASGVDYAQGDAVERPCLLGSL